MERSIYVTGMRVATVLGLLLLNITDGKTFRPSEIADAVSQLGWTHMGIVANSRNPAVELVKELSAGGTFSNHLRNSSGQGNELYLSGTLLDTLKTRKPFSTLVIEDDEIRMESTLPNVSVGYLSLDSTASSNGLQVKAIMVRNNFLDISKHT